MDRFSTVVEKGGEEGRMLVSRFQIGQGTLATGFSKMTHCFGWNLEDHVNPYSLTEDAWFFTSSLVQWSSLLASFCTESAIRPEYPAFSQASLLDNSCGLYACGPRQIVSAEAHWFILQIMVVLGRKKVFGSEGGNRRLETMTKEDWLMAVNALRQCLNE